MRERVDRECKGPEFRASHAWVVMVFMANRGWWWDHCNVFRTHEGAKRRREDLLHRRGYSRSDVRVFKWEPRRVV